MEKFLCGVAAAAITLSSSPVLAQQTALDTDQAEQSGIGDIVVTAQRRNERSQDVPIALTAFTSADITEQRVRTLADMDSLAPGLRISNADAAANPKIFIRGVGLNDFNPTSSSGVGMYVDGVYIGSLLAQLAGFYDLAQVEVLRGPQGTLFGRNTTGGAINITTQQPTFDTRANLSLEYGRFNEVNASAGVGGTLVDGLVAYRAAGMLARDDGHTVNRFNGDRVNNGERYAGRLTLLVTPGPDTEITLSGNRFWNRGGARQPKSRPLFPTTAAATGADGLCAPGFYNSGQCTDAVGYAETNSDPYSINSNLTGQDRIDLWGVSGQINQRFGDIDLVSVTAFSRVKRDALENTDASPLQMVEINYASAQRQFTQELRLQGKTGPATWVIGGYYMHELVTNDTSTDLLRLLRPMFVSPTNPTGASPANSVAVFTNPTRQVTDSYAFFGQLDYALTDRLFGTVGLRWSADEKAIDYVRKAEGVDLFAVNRSKTFSDFSGRLGLRFEATPDWNLYATFNRGYKSGGFFGGSADSPEQIDPYDNETVNAYEVGSKVDLFDRTVRLNLSAFYYDYKDIQAFSQVERNGLTVLILDNAASAKVYGGEIDLLAEPVDGLKLTATASYLNANYGTYVSLGNVDYTGNRMPHAPRWSLTGGARYEIPLADGGTITPRIDMSYRTRVYFDSTERSRLSDRSAFLLNGEIGWSLPGDRVEFGIWGKNLTDHVYPVGISAIDSLGVDLISYAAPRTFGGFIRFTY